VTADVIDFAVEWPRVVGATLRAFGDIHLAEESAQEAFARAAGRLAAGEQIDNIGAWATTVARRVAIDSIRHDAVLRAKLPLLVSEVEVRAAEEGTEQTTHPVDDRLGLILVACDPALSPEQQIVLALRIACGVPTVDIARFLGSAEPTIAARLTRAKKAIARSGVRFAWPSPDERRARLGGALTTVYGVYTLGHSAAAGDELVDSTLASLALELARDVVAEYPDDTEALGLLAIIELGEARRPGRVRADGMPLALAEVDRSAWGRRRIRHGLDLAALALPGGGRFALQAGIAGLHSSAESWGETDWGAIATLYHGLVRVWPAPMARLGLAIAQSHGAQPTQAIAEIESTRAVGEPLLRRRAAAALAEIYERQGNAALARDALDDAAVGESNAALLRYYERVRSRLADH
jgi:RNA polymerase sigma-70 factor (ECF subfamily)